MDLQSNAPSCTVKAAMYEHIGTYIDKKDGNKVKVRNPKNGYPLKVKTIKDIIYSQLSITEGTKKNYSGGVFPFAYDTMYSVNDEDIDFHSSGVVFQDLDHIPDNDLRAICDNFDLLCKYLPDLFCIHYSSSGKGLHAYYLSPSFTPEEYTKRAILNYIRLGVVCSRFLGIEFPTNICDEHQVSIKQRFFLNRPMDSKILWNDKAFGVIFPSNQEDELINKEVHKYLELEKKWNRMNYKSSEKSSIEQIKSFETSEIERKSKIVPHLGHKSRMLLYSSLRAAFKDDPKTVATEWDYCMRHMEYTSEHNTQLKDALREPDNNHAWKTYKTPHISKEFFLFYDVNEYIDTGLDDKVSKVRHSTPKLTDEERELLEKYL